ncbi:CZB domain-containing protein [Sulfurimonas sp.]
MTRLQTLQAIENAKEAHLSQMDKIEALMEGRSVRNPTSVDKTECEFGKWFYGNAEFLKFLLGAQFYKNIDAIHEYWHIEYEKIYDIFMEKSTGSMVAKLMGFYHIPPKEMDEVLKYYKELKITSKDLLKALEASKRRILALKESKFIV